MNLGGTTHLLTRSLRVDARCWWTYALRLGLVLCVLLALVGAHERASFLGAPGLGLFQFVVFINFAFITLAGVSVFATAITEEKEEMTLGLLRMTDLNAIAILLAKAGSRLVSALLLLLAQLPFTLLAITLGGVSIQQVVAAYCTLGAYLVMLCALGLLCSVLCARSRSAAALATLVTLAFLVGPWVARGLRWERTAMGAARTVLDQMLLWLTAASPITHLWTIAQTGFDAGPIGFQVLANLGAALVLAAAAWLCFEPFNRDQVPAGPTRGGLVDGAGPRRRSRLVWGPALIWKDHQFIAGGGGQIVIRLVLYAAITVAIALALLLQDGPWEARSLGPAMMSIFFALAILEAALLAAHIFSDEVRWRTWAGLVVLPTSLRRVVWHKIAGCAVGLAPVSLFFIAGALLYPPALRDMLAGLREEPAATALGAVSILFFLHLVAYLSLWLRWGALAAAVGIMLLGLIGLGMIMPDATLVVLIMLAATVAMHLHTGRRLLRLASE